jgi:hypothetical protein
MLGLNSVRVPTRYMNLVVSKKPEFYGAGGMLLLVTISLRHGYA